MVLVEELSNETQTKQFQEYSAMLIVSKGYSFKNWGNQCMKFHICMNITQRTGDIYLQPVVTLTQDERQYILFV